MQPPINKLLIDLQEQLNFINIEIDDPIVACEQAIEITLKSLEQLKKFVLKRKFKSTNEEINFFKEIKPQFSSKFIYYNKIYKMETKRPYGGQRVVKKFYRNELRKLKLFFDSELEFYRYFRTGSNYLDHKYFVRGKLDVKLSLNSFYFESDKNFATTHSYKVAKIIAHDLLQVYLEDKLLLLENKQPNQKSQVNPKIKQNWTGSKVALIELLYALHSEGVFNNGASDLKDIAAYFEDTFNINLGQYHRAFLEIRMRKGDRTKFMTSLKESLKKRMDNSDE
ncbi:tetracycline regulation of excision, RteC [Pseudalgibacter alginicilyticus]|uniref:Tetracycline regulation of excision, RteC n=1 Tax=Pseudalgibacter alginicilyticus TaxID=1736674 RepID=A0A0P0D2Q1_9FLAO|nr:MULTISPECIES: RteC domain-containing protein [Flavobacteriaceae]ALJ04128.1 tetracycline regulation of excision, RteC [Pseudalgibacter alginicilyticus]